MIFPDIFMTILFIIYIICVFIEIKLLKRNKIDIFYKQNLLLVLISSVSFPLAIFALFFGYHAIKNSTWDSKDEIAFNFYLFTFILASLTYIIHDIKRKLYAFISPNNKLSFLGFKTLYDTRNQND